MRFEELYERKLDISDEKKTEFIRFIIDWLGGKYMHSNSNDAHEDTYILKMWAEINKLYPTRKSPMKLMRLVTLPIEYADKKNITLNSAGPIGRKLSSWSSTYFGIWSVQGIAKEFNDGIDTCRVVIQTIIEPQYILANYNSIKKIFLHLTSDFDYEKYDGGEYEGGYHGLEQEYIQDIGYIAGSLEESSGGYLRQYEYIVINHPVNAKIIRVFRKGKEVFDGGHDDPHNSGKFMGWR